MLSLISISVVVLLNASSAYVHSVEFSSFVEEVNLQAEMMFDMWQLSNHDGEYLLMPTVVTLSFCVAYD